MQPLFPRWYNPNKRFEYHRGFLGHTVEQLPEFQESSPEIGEQRWAEFVEDDVINHFVTRTSLEWQDIKIAWQNIDIARKWIQEGC
jgi:hypothetical protein